VLIARGRLDQALPMSRSAIDRDPHSASAHAARANVFYIGRRCPEAERVLSELENATRAAPVPPIAFALMYAGLG
jgi:predicted Zn-dependent protease